jgi:hypothetical protein
LGLSTAAPLAEPEQMEVVGRALPTPVSAATARTYLASRMWPIPLSILFP